MKVLVTGANGHLGTNLVADLKAAGHAVRASVRDRADSAKTRQLEAIGGIEIVSADLDEPLMLRAAMDGVDAVMHTAAVYQLYAPGKADGIVRASVEGIRHAMQAARDAGVKRFVLTSSTVTLPLTRPGERPIDETAWTADVSVPYIRAKTEGERLAWRLAGELGIDLATILPGAFGGPGFQRNTPTIDVVEAVAKGALQFGAPAINYPWVDVRDVSAAHVLALERGARGRYLIVNDLQPSMAEIGRVLAGIDPSIPKPQMSMPSFVLPLMPVLEGLSSRISGAPRVMTPELAAHIKGKVWNLSNAKARRDLGWVPKVSLEDSLRDTLAALKALGRC